MGKRKSFTGIVTSDKMQKTRIVKIMRLVRHIKYGKIIKHYNKFKAHDEKNLSKAGDTVLIEETRPLSKDKHFMITKVLQKAKAAQVELKEEAK